MNTCASSLDQKSSHGALALALATSQQTVEGCRHRRTQLGTIRLPRA